jgi:hypothetical protein
MEFDDLVRLWNCFCISQNLFGALKRWLFLTAVASGCSKVFFELKKKGLLYRHIQAHANVTRTETVCPLTNLFGAKNLCV